LPRGPLPILGRGPRGKATRFARLAG